MFRIPHTRQTVYLSASWADRNRRLNLSIASLLTTEGLIVIGEHPTRPSDLGGMDYPERVDEYLKHCAGIVLVFPFRPDRPQSTSSAMFIELLVAAKHGLPSLIILENGVTLATKVVNAETTLAFGQDTGPDGITRYDDVKEQLSDDNIRTFNSTPVIYNTSTIVISTPHFIETTTLPPHAPSLNLSTASDLIAAIAAFARNLARPKSPQHVFQISPYSRERDRLIMADVVYRVTGLKCVNGSDPWAGAANSSEREITSQIANALFVLADLSGSRGACLFEVGCAIGAGRPVSVIRTKTDGELPFGLRMLQVNDYDSEEELRNVTTQCCWPFRRRVFNIEVESENTGTGAGPSISGPCTERQLPSRDWGSVDVAAITIREDEYRALSSRLDGRSIVPGPNRTYTIGKVKRSNGPDCTLAVVRMTEQGPGQAQDTARDVIEDLHPRWLALVGIGGGLPDSEFTLGDVIIATRLHDFTVGAYLQDSAQQFTNMGGPMTKLVQDLAGLLPGLDSQIAGWETESALGVSRPQVSLEDTNFYGSTEWISKARGSLERVFGSNGRAAPIATARSIASSGFLIKDADLVELWRNQARDVAAVEMELAGIYHAARRMDKEYPILAVRGLSDIVGFKREPGWTAYACNSAASFFLALLREMPQHYLI